MDCAIGVLYGSLYVHIVYLQRRGVYLRVETRELPSGPRTPALGRIRRGASSSQGTFLLYLFRGVLNWMPYLFFWIGDGVDRCEGFAPLVGPGEDKQPAWHVLRRSPVVVRTRYLL